MKSTLRRVRFSPYRKGAGPTFQLDLWEGPVKFEAYGHRQYVGYRLIMSLPAKAGELARIVKLFEGEDIGLGMMQDHDLASDETVRAVMSWLTLRPGDTDGEFFANATPEQLAYYGKYAEDLKAEVDARFGEPE